MNFPLLLLPLLVGNSPDIQPRIISRREKSMASLERSSAAARREVGLLEVRQQRITSRCKSTSDVTLDQCLLAGHRALEAEVNRTEDISKLSFIPTSTRTRQ